MCAGIRCFFVKKRSIFARHVSDAQCIQGILNVRIVDGVTVVI